MVYGDTSMSEKLSIVTIVNNEKLYSRSRKSLEWQGVKDYFDFIPIDADRFGWNASKSLNHGIEKAKSDWVVCSHQDVIFPDIWLKSFLSELSKVPDRVGVIGLVGNTSLGRYVGHIKDPHGHSKWPPLPSKVISVDEHVIIINRRLNIRFDEANPGFHCYGTDICLTAKKMGYESLVIDSPVVHLSGGKIDDSYSLSSQWMLRKWGKTMNNIIPTCATIITSPDFSNLFKRTIIYINRYICSKKIIYSCNCNKIHATDF